MAHRRNAKDRAQPAPAQAPPSPPSPDKRSAFFEDAGLKVLVFTAGGVLMGLEIAGSRVLAPHFGNSVFVWGSLISVFLIALSLGYYFGGRVADRHPSRLLLNSICLAVAVLIFVIPLYAGPFCEALVEEHWGEQSGPLIASLVLFLPASLGMGMVSPFAIRLATRSVSSVGRSSGTLYALSTTGSIAGTLLTTFVLVPMVGLAAILKGLSLALAAAAVLTLPSWRGKQGMTGAAALGLLALACWFAEEPPRTPLGIGDRLVVDVDTPYHHIAVVDNESQDLRELRFDRYIESGIYLKEEPHAGYESYTDYFQLAFLAQPDIKRALFIGAGGGVGPRAFHAQDPRMEIDVVEHRPQGAGLGPIALLPGKGPRNPHHCRGRPDVRARTDRKYDCLILDAFTIGGRIPFHLVTREFLQQCQEKMSPRGVFVMNINSALEGPLSPIFRSMFRTVEAVFPRVYVFSRYYRRVNPQQSTNVIFVATEDRNLISPEQWLARAAQFRSNSYVGPDRLQRLAEDLVIDPPKVADAPMFSDNYAPIETMPF